MRPLLQRLDYGVPKYKLCLVREKAHRHREPVVIRSPEDAADLLTPIRSASEEYFISLHLNAKNEVLAVHEVSHGTLSESLVHPREVFKAALMANSYAIIVCHNHPSGSKVKPSREDFSTTQQLITAGKLLGVSLVDHLVVGLHGDDHDSDDWLFSFRQSHPELWRDHDRDHI